MIIGPLLRLRLFYFMKIQVYLLGPFLEKVCRAVALKYAATVCAISLASLNLV